MIAILLRLLIYPEILSHSFFIFNLGSLIYSSLTVALHPLTVVKIRKQVLSNDNSAGNLSNSNLSVRHYYRGLGVVVSLAIPARIIYVSVLEYSRELIDHNARYVILDPPSVFNDYEKHLLGLLPLVAPFSGGISGGLAAASSQLIIVPMDVISQKLIVMGDSTYKHKGCAISVTKSVISREGLRGIYKGFGLSLFTSLPTGSVWWATYAGCKDQLSVYGNPNVFDSDDVFSSMKLVAHQGFIQIICAFNAALAASILTQPLDTIKTRLQVGADAGNASSNASIFSVAKNLTATSGLYKGLWARVAHMGIWGSVLSSAYEYLKLICRKDYSF